MKHEAATMVKELKATIKIVRSLDDLLEGTMPSLYPHEIYVHGNYELARKMQQRLKVPTMKKSGFEVRNPAMQIIKDGIKVHVFITDLPPHCRIVQKQVVLPAQDALPERSSTVREIVCDDPRSTPPEEMAGGHLESPIA